MVAERPRVGAGGAVHTADVAGDRVTQRSQQLRERAVEVVAVTAAALAARCASPSRPDRSPMPHRRAATSSRRARVPRGGDAVVAMPRPTAVRRPTRVGADTRPGSRHRCAPTGRPRPRVLACRARPALPSLRTAGSGPPAPTAPARVAARIRPPLASRSMAMGLAETAARPLIAPTSTDRRGRSESCACSGSA